MDNNRHGRRDRRRINHEEEKDNMLKSEGYEKIRNGQRGKKEILRQRLHEIKNEYKKIKRKRGKNK